MKTIKRFFVGIVFIAVCFIGADTDKISGLLTTEDFTISSAHAADDDVITQDEIDDFESQDWSGEIGED